MRASEACRLLQKFVPALALLAALFWPVLHSSADIGPKPEMRFSFVYELDPPPQILAGEQLECQDAACTDARPLQRLGPQGFSCDGSECRSMAYGYAPYHKLRIRFSDAVRESNVFTHAGGIVFYRVTVRAQDLLVEESKRSSAFCPGLFTTVGVEFFLTALLVAARGLPHALLGLVPLANLVTVPAVWWLVGALPLPGAAALLVAELFATSFEAGFLALALRTSMRARRLAMLAIALNGASALFGLLLPLA